MGLEILEDARIKRVICGYRRRRVDRGVGAAIKAQAPHMKVLGAEPETAAPFGSHGEQARRGSFEAWQDSFVDGAGGRSVIPRMWERMKPVDRRRDRGDARRDAQAQCG